MHHVRQGARQRHAHHDGAQVGWGWEAAQDWANITADYYFREQEDVFAEEILEPYCKFCYAKMFKMSAIKIQEICEIAPDTAYCI